MLLIVEIYPNHPLAKIAYLGPTYSVAIDMPLPSMIFIYHMNYQILLETAIKGFLILISFFFYVDILTVG